VSAADRYSAMELLADTPTGLRDRATRYREMGRTVTDRRALEALTSLAAEYDAIADRWELGTAPTVHVVNRGQHAD
jgi:hypothetical protein